MGIRRDVIEGELKEKNLNMRCSGMIVRRSVYLCETGTIRRRRRSSRGSRILPVRWKRKRDGGRSDDRKSVLGWRLTTSVAADGVKHHEGDGWRSRAPARCSKRGCGADARSLRQRGCHRSDAPEDSRNDRSHARSTTNWRKREINDTNAANARNESSFPGMIRETFVLSPGNFPFCVSDGV